MFAENKIMVNAGNDGVVSLHKEVGTKKILLKTLSIL